MARAPFGMAEDELVVALERGAPEVRLERGDERGRESDRALGLLRLGAAHAQDAFQQVDVAPAELAQLVSADAGQDEDHEDRGRLLVYERLANAGDLGRLEDPPLALRLLGMLGAMAGFASISSSRIAVAKTSCSTDRSRLTVEASIASRYGATVVGGSSQCGCSMSRCLRSGL
jgi:hypothetical protein